MTIGSMKIRLEFCLSMLDEGSIPHDPRFNMYNIVHIDEK